MKKAAPILVLLYACLFVVLTIPVFWGSFYPDFELPDVLDVFAAWQYWIVLGLMLFCEVGLLLVPVKVTNLRPVSRRTIYLPIITSGLLIGCLLFGIVCSLMEVYRHDLPFKEAWQFWSAIGASVFLWIVWSIVFARAGRNAPPHDVVPAQCRHLLKGSVLALLIAVPTHIVARHREYCCAGFGTFVGIVFGVAVMLISFGPGVFFLYSARWKKLHPAAGRGENGQGKERGEKSTR